MEWAEILEHYPHITGIHPAAEIFPIIAGEDFTALCRDIKNRGLAQPVILSPDGLLLDGRSRLRACYEVRQEVLIDYYKGSDPIGFSVSANLCRRHLTVGQKAIVALEIEKLEAVAARERQRLAGASNGKGSMATPKLVDDRPQAIEPAPKARDRAAAAVGVSGKAVQRAKTVAKSAPDLLPAVRNGTMTLDAADKQARQRERQAAASRPAPERPIPAAADTLTLLDYQGNPYSYPRAKGTVTFNQQKGTEIGWAMWSWNPVTGCNHGCSYCYARSIATAPDMSTYYPAGFTPLFHHERLDAPANTTVPARATSEPAFGRVFVCSMADLFGAWVPQAWIDQVVAATVANPQWEYLYLTKFPQRYHRLELPSTGWIGASIDEQHRVEHTLDAMRQVSGVKVKWLSLEPLIQPLAISSLEGIDWIVIGAQSANPGQNPAFAPPFEWVADIVHVARRDGCRVWLKTNLLGQTSDQWPGMSLPQEAP